MGAISDLWKSERGLFAIALVIGATVLAAMAIMSVDQWIDYTKWIFGIYAGSKAITTSVQSMVPAKTGAASDQPAGGA